MKHDKLSDDFKKSLQEQERKELEQEARREMNQRGRRYYRTQMVWEWVTAMLIGAGVIGVIIAAMAVFVD